MASCVFCGQSEGKITREHLWPTALHSRLQIARNQRLDQFWSARERKTIPSEPTIRDVCQSCNNGPLSELDAYICNLWDTQLRVLRKRGDRIVFQYDYGLLTRSLLKLCFNAARMHKNDLPVYKDYVRYILNGECSPADFRVFVQVVPPGYITIQEIPSMPAGISRIYKPHGHRVGFYFFKDTPGRQKMLRAIHLRSFSFFIAFFKPGGSSEEIDVFVESFLFTRPETRVLLPTSEPVVVTCDGIDAWHSFRRSRSELVFGPWRDHQPEV